MYPGGLVTLALSIWSAGVLAFPSPLNDIAERNIDTKDSEPDILWEKYGLNTSAEYKYFHEPGRDDILGHYDIRFFNGTVSDEERAVTLTHMTRAYLNFFNDNDLETWISHGTLLGWWWNGKVHFTFASFLRQFPMANKPSIDPTMGLGYRHPSPRHHTNPPRRPLQPHESQIRRRQNNPRPRIPARHQPVGPTARQRTRTQYHRCTMDRHKNRTLHRHHGA